VCSKDVPCVLNTKINHGQTELCNTRVFPYFAVFCLSFIQKWNECIFFQVIGFVCLKGGLYVPNTKINHGRTELYNISIFGSILLVVCLEVE
jgi:hypothetical protein